MAEPTQPERPPSRPRLTRPLLLAASVLGLAGLGALSLSSPASPQGRPAAERPGPAPSSNEAAGPVTGQRALPPLSAFTPELVRNLRAIRERSGARRDDVFMKVGDSSTVSRAFLECFASEHVNLAADAALEPTVAFFRGGNAGGRDPFRRQTLAAAEGWSARHVLSGRPPPLMQELHATQARFAFAMNGGNDVEGRDEVVYGQRMVRIVEMLSRVGTIPILNSLPPRGDSAEADRWARRYNRVSWAIAEAFELPYLDYHQVMLPLPRRGLASDGVHPNALLHNGRARACDFSPAGLQHGHNQRNRLALRALDRLRRTVIEGEAPPDPSRPSLPGEGTVSAPIEVDALPFATLGDTSDQGSAEIDRYPGCDAEQNEAGREIVYRLRVNAPTRLRATAISLDGADVDIHLLGETPSGEACVARDDRTVEHTLSPGVWHIAVDTFVDDGGTPRAGRFLLLLDRTQT